MLHQFERQRGLHGVGLFSNEASVHLLLLRLLAAHGIEGNLKQQ